MDLIFKLITGGKESFKLDLKYFFAIFQGLTFRFVYDFCKILQKAVLKTVFNTYHTCFFLLETMYFY